MFRTSIIRSSAAFKAQVSPMMAIPFYGNISLNTKNMISRRFNSTKSSEIPLEIKTELTTFDNNIPEIQTISTSDQLGYLDSIGMAQGYGPTALIERILEYAHVYTGLPWWGTIIVTTFVVRSVMFPLYVKSSINAAKMSKVKPELDKVMQDLKEAESPQEQVQAAQRRKNIMKENDIHLSHQVLPMLQLPVAYGFFQALRKMANHPVEGMSTQGYAWFTDLTQVDPYLGLQSIAAIVVIGMVRLGGETGAHQMNPMMKKVMTWVPILSILVTKELSAAVVLYFAANSIFSFLQTSILRSHLFRKLAKMPPIVKPPVVPGAPPQPTTIKDWWKDFNQNVNKSVEKKMKESNNKIGAIHKRKKSNSSGFIKRH